jgi:hypothetical protein
MPLSITIKQGDNKNKFVVGMFSRTVPQNRKKRQKTHGEQKRSRYLSTFGHFDYVFLPFF